MAQDLNPALIASLDHHRPRSLLALCFAATSGWALRGADGIVTSGTLPHAPLPPSNADQCDLAHADWLGAADLYSGPIAGITVVSLPPFLASAMHPSPAQTLQAWAYLRSIPCEVTPYLDLMRFDASGADIPLGGHTPNCHAEAIAIHALGRMIALKGAVA